MDLSESTKPEYFMAKTHNSLTHEMSLSKLEYLDGFSLSAKKAEFPFRRQKYAIFVRVKECKGKPRLELARDQTTLRHWVGIMRGLGCAQFTVKENASG